MILNNGDKVIFDSDIVMTNNHLGGTLGDILENLDESIKQLKRNVKFLYLYGGVGTHGGSGGSSSDWKIYATLDSLTIDGKIIYLDSPGTHSLKILIVNVSGISLFGAMYEYSDSKGKVSPSSSRRLTLDNLFTITIPVLLDINSTITVTVTSEDGEPKSVTSNFIVNPYSFVLNFGDKNGRLTLNDNPNFYLQQILNDGLYAYLTYDIGLEGDYAVYYTDFEGTYHDEQLIDYSESKTGKLQLSLASPEFFTNKNSGYYSLTIYIKITREGYRDVTLQRSLSCNLIPSTLYLKIFPEKGGILYDQIQDEEDDIYDFNLGGNVFNVEVFEGSNEGRSYTLEYSITFLDGGSTITYNPTYLIERNTYPVYFQFGHSGWASITFLVSRGQLTYSVTKYVHISSVAGNLEWEYYYLSVYDNYSVNYKRYYINNENVCDGSVGTQLKQIFNNQTLTQSSSTSAKEIIFEKDPTFDQSELLLNIGILLNTINDFEQEIVSLLNTSNEKQKIKIFLNKVEIGLSENSGSIEIFIPTYDSIDTNNNEQFHLLTIYKRYYARIDEKSYYCYDIYIDGSLEGSLLNFTAENIFYDKLIFNNLNYCINLFDLAYYTSYVNGNIFNDGDMVKYFYTYHARYGIDVSEDKIKINEILSRDFIIDSEEDGFDTGMVTLSTGALKDLADIESLASILVIDYTDTKRYKDAPLGSNENFLKWYLWRPASDSEPDDTGSLTVLIEYRPQGSRGLVPILLPPDAYFLITKQGTSTRTWFAKNLTLKINSKDKTYLFSPNFESISENDTNEDKLRKYNTFLPELEFTLKKDVVDSAHSNNNAIADFVNNNTKKFNTNEVHSKYLNYVKNCLTGFPCLIFAQVTYLDQETLEKETKVYYLGYYNFNLGRESHYNLGHKLLSTLDNLYKFNSATQKEEPANLTSGFNIYSVYDEHFKSGLMVSEILNNNDYFDFSLFHPSILFGIDTIDNDFSMWGDYVPKTNASVIKNKLLNLVSGISKAGGYIFDLLKKRKGPQTDGYNAVFTDPEKSNYKTSKNLVPNYKLQYKRTVDTSSGSKIYVFDLEVNEATERDLQNAVVSNETITPLLDYESLVDYYVIIMAFCMVDSIEKNMNVKSWNNGETWYLAFYDMDTCLGINNAGENVNYNAFTDYWDIINLEESNELKPATIYRDFWPKSKAGDSFNKGFDTPSSYLFAIAKYAKLLLGSYLENNTYPLDRWTQFRGSLGELRNAKYFIEKYYSGRTDQVGESLMNYNYRTTYLHKNPGENSKITGYRSLDYGKFKGNRKYSTESWLNERLHILDAYMGIMSSDSEASRRYIQYLNENDEWEILPLFKDLGILPGTSISDNQDVIILKDIFTNATAGIKYSANIRTEIRALPNSFVIVSSPEGVSSYMILDQNKTYLFRPSYSPTSNVRFGGSLRWTYISDISQFVTGAGELYVNSPNLLNFTMSSEGNFHNPITSGSYMPSVKTININGLGYDFTLTNINDIFPGVLNIDISNSKVNLEHNSINNTINSIQAENMNCNSFRVTNCNYLENVSISGTFLSIELMYKKDLSLTDITCKNMTLVGVEEGRSISILNNTTLDTLILRNYENIEIINCTSLKTITIDNPEKVKTLYIKNCCTSSKTLSLNSSEEKIINLTEFTNIENISFASATNKSNPGFVEVRFPDKDCDLSPSCFSYCTNLKTLTIPSGKYVYITGASTFNCTSIETLSQIRVKDNVQNLASTFSVYGGGASNVVFLQANNFLTNLPENNSITNINSIFRSQSKLETTSNNLLNLSKLKLVTTATYAFSATKVIYVKRNMFNGFGAQNINITGIFGGIVGGILNCAIDCFSDLGPKLFNDTRFLILFNPPSSNITEYSFSDSNPSKIKFISNATDPSEIYVKNFFAGFEDKILGIYCLNFAEQYNMDGFFNELQKLTYIYYSFNNMQIYGRDGGTPDFTNLGLGSSNVKYIYKSFLNLESSLYIDLNSMVNWEKFENINSLTVFPSGFLSSGFGGNNMLLYKSFTGVRKYITKENYDSIWEKINKSKYYTIIGNIFENTLLISNNNDDIVPSLTLNNVVRLDATFKNFEIVVSKVTEDSSYEEVVKVPIVLDNIISNFPKCILFTETFRGILLEHTLPYNFFKRRGKKVVDKHVIDTNSGNRIPAKYVYYEYTLDITNLSYCFSEVKINGEHKYFKYDSNSSIYSLPKNRILIEENGEYVDKFDINTYYDNAESTNELFIKDNNEILDATQEVEVDYFITTYYIDKATITNTTPLGTISSTFIDAFFVVPDLLYGCKSTCNLSFCFENSEFTGALPKHFIFPNSANLELWLHNVDILPQYVGEYRKKKGEAYAHYNFSFLNELNEIIQKVYTFVPEGFCSNYLNLSYAFTFHTRIPDIISDFNNGIKSYYLFLDTSFPNTLSHLANSLPEIPIGWETNFTIDSTLYHPYDMNLADNNPIYYNIMFNTQNVYLENGNNYSGNDGINYNSNLYIDSLFDGTYLALSFGYLFSNTSKNIKSYKRQKTYSIYFSTTYPRFVILPPSTAGYTNKYVATSVGSTLRTHLKLSQILGNSSIYSTDLKLNNIEIIQ